MLLYALGDQASVRGLIDFLGIAEPDQVVGGVTVGLLYSVIQATCRKAQWSDWVLFRFILEADHLQDNQVTYQVLVSLDILESGFQFRILL